MSRSFSELSRAVGVGAIVAIVLAVLSYFAGEFYPETKPITLVLTAFLTVFVVYADLILRRLGGRATGAGRRISRSMLRVPLDWRKELAEEIVQDTHDALNALASPKEEYYSEEALYRAMTAEVNKMPASDAVFAVCADKTWNAEYVKDYLTANTERARNGVTIKRIFYEFSGRVIDAARDQAAGGISAWVLRAQQLDTLKPPARIAPDFGIAIFGERTVFIHSGIGTNARGSRYECSRLAALIRARFSMVERLAEHVAPPLPLPLVRASIKVGKR